jgi:hypothetical protein
MKYITTVLGQNTPCVNFLATGTRVSPNLYKIFYQNKESALEATQAQFYTSYFLTVNKNNILSCSMK